MRINQSRKNKNIKSVWKQKTNKKNVNKLLPKRFWLSLKNF